MKETKTKQKVYKYLNEIISTENFSWIKILIIRIIN